eukprot:GHUV01008895.1.p3 GENE.GHUV01008895.1~~GHUV01008895.1.p3  ORF type:complete len:130 (+),score=36.95 GHUV01008895.1:2993-3382(+)
MQLPVAAAQWRSQHTCRSQTPAVAGFRLDSVISKSPTALTMHVHHILAVLDFAGSQLIKPLLLVSDLDDTLLGNAIKDVDSHSTTFKTVWERSRALGINCKLAINTGRCADLLLLHCSSSSSCATEQHC